MKLEFVKVKVVEGEWMGHKPPSVITILKQKAEELEARKVVEILAPEEKKEEKKIDKPGINKMITSAPVNKGGRPPKDK